MSRRKESGLIAEADVTVLRKEFGVLGKTVEELVKGGVKEEDLDKVLEIRETLKFATQTLEGESDVDQIAIAPLVRAYQVLGRDTDLLEQLAERIQDWAADLRAGDSGHWKKFYLHSSFNSAMNRALDAIEERQRNRGILSLEFLDEWTFGMAFPADEALGDLRDVDMMTM